MVVIRQIPEAMIGIEVEPFSYYAGDWRNAGANVLFNSMMEVFSVCMPYLREPRIAVGVPYGRTTMLYGFFDDHVEFVIQDGLWWLNRFDKIDMEKRLTYLYGSSHYGISSNHLTNIVTVVEAAYTETLSPK